MAISETKSFIKYFFFTFVFIVAFSLINIPKVELFGFFLFFAVNIVFCLFLGKDFIDGSISSEGKNTEWMLKYGVIIVSMVFSLVSSIMMVLTLVTLRGKFAEYDSAIEWSPTDRRKLDDAKVIFITVTTFISVVALYIYNTPEDVRKFTYTLFDNILNGSNSDSAFDTILNGSIGNWIRVLFPVVVIGLGSALYGRLQMPPLEVNKTPKRVVCDPSNDPALQGFKDSFIKTYWFLFAFLIVVLSRPFVEANFNLFGLSPSSPLGFAPGDRSLIFGQNPSISLLSLLTLGISNLMGVNRRMSKKMDEEPAEVKNGKDVSTFRSVIAGLFGAFVLLLMLSAKNSTALLILILALLIGFGMFIASFFMPKDSKSGAGKAFSVAVRSILLMPILRWDVIYLLAKYAFGFVGLLYAGFSIRDFQNIPDDDPCFFKEAHIRQLYIAFIVFLIIYYTFNTLSSSMITSIITNVMRFLVPPALLGLSSYLVFITNYFMLMSPKLIVQ